jgi:hypothetical protein
MIIDYPFDDADRYPADDVHRVHEVRSQLGEEDTVIWLPHFLSEDRPGRPRPCAFRPSGAGPLRTLNFTAVRCARHGISLQLAAAVARPNES